MSFSGSKPIVVLSFLAKSADSCNLSRVSESIAVRHFQVYVKWQAESLLSTRLTKSSMGGISIDLMCRGHAGMRRTSCSECMQRKKSSERRKLTSSASVKSSATREETYFRKIWSKALCCVTVISGRRFKSFVIEALLLQTPVRSFFLVSGRTTIL